MFTYNISGTEYVLLTVSKETTEYNFPIAPGGGVKFKALTASVARRADRNSTWVRKSDFDKIRFLKGIVVSIDTTPVEGRDKMVASIYRDYIPYESVLTMEDSNVTLDEVNREWLKDIDLSKFYTQMVNGELCAKFFAKKYEDGSVEYWLSTDQSSEEEDLAWIPLRLVNREKGKLVKWLDVYDDEDEIVSFKDITRI